MDRRAVVAITLLVSTPVDARGRHGYSNTPAWFDYLLAAIIIGVLLYHLKTKPIATLRTLGAVIGLPVLLWLAVIALERSFGIWIALAAVPFLWLAMSKAFGIVLGKGSE